MLTLGAVRVRSGARLGGIGNGASADEWRRRCAWLSVRESGARGCTLPYFANGGKGGALPHLSVRRKIVDKLRGMWYNGGGRQLCPTVERRERKGEAKANETRAKVGGLLQV